MNFTILLERHHAMLWRMCWQRAGGDRDRCCDLMQDVSIALWENIDKLRPDATPRQERAWVCWQARSVFYQAERRQKPTTVPLSDTLADKISDEDTQQRKELLDELFSALDPDEQRMVRLYLEGYNGDEIGKELGISRNNFYQRMYRVIRKMRRIVLLLIVLLFSSAVAVTLVPEWRHFIFSRRWSVKEVINSIPEEKVIITEDILPQDTIKAPIIHKDTTLVVEPLEDIPSLSLLDILEMSDKPPVLEQKKHLIISVSGTRLTIMGAEGEDVRVYDLSGKLVAATTASGLCVIDLFPNTNIMLVNNFHYRLQIGNRQPMRLEL